MPRRILVLGGGIAGLAAAWRVKADAKKGETVTLLEAGARVGGAIETEKHQGYVIEKGPDCFLSTKPGGVELCQELGITIVGTRESCRRSLLVHAGRLVPVPEGFYLLAPDSLRTLWRSKLFSFKGKWNMAMDLFRKARTDVGDESLADFVRRRFGQEALERLAQPMVAGITTADPEKLSMRATFPQFAEMEQTHGSVIRALRGRKDAAQASGPRYGLFVAPAAGMQAIVDALREKLKPVIRTNARVAQLMHSGEAWVARLENGDTVEADGVVVALPAPQAARILRAVEARVAELLDAVPHASTMTVNLAWREEEAAFPEAMGYVAPEIEQRFVLACSFSSRKFANRAPEGYALARAFCGGALHPDVLSLRDEDIVEKVQNDLKQLHDIAASPLFTRVTRHPNSMPQYHVGHLERVAELEERASRLPGLALAGASYRGVGVPDCIRSGEIAATRVMGSV